MMTGEGVTGPLGRWREKGRKKQQHMIWAGRISLQSISKKSFIDNKHKKGEETCFLWQTSYLYYWKLMEKARKCVYSKKITHFLLDLMNPVYQSISSKQTYQTGDCFVSFSPAFYFISFLSLFLLLFSRIFYLIVSTFDRPFSYPALLFLFSVSHSSHLPPSSFSISFDSHFCWIPELEFHNSA